MIVFFIIWKVRERRIYKSQLAPKVIVNKLKIKKFDKFKRLSNESELCAICLDDYVNDDILRILPCSHMFHQSCIGKLYKLLLLKILGY